MDFSKALRQSAHETRTENGQYAHNTTGDRLLDFYSVVGSLRSRDVLNKQSLFAEAYNEDKLLATKCLFYARDVRGGLGERETFRQLLEYAAKHHPEAIIGNIALIPEYGRFDDLYSLIGTPLESEMWQFIREQFKQDVADMYEGKPVSLLGKWLKSVDASSVLSRQIAYDTAKHLYLDPTGYKKLVRKLRKHIGIVERYMTRNEWSDINYEAVPSRASMIYRNAFCRHDGARYGEYIRSVESGEAKINASTLYPYDIIEKVMNHGESNATLEALWKNLPNYVEPGTNALVIADTSGSMYYKPICTSIGLALYFAERNTGAFHNLFMTFSSRSDIEEIRGETLEQKVNNLSRAHWGNNTNLEAAFDNVLEVAVRNHVANEDMVKALIIISDMEIDNCCEGLFYDEMKSKYARHGYDLPNVIFWNVNSRNNVFHADSKRKGVQLVSGQSASTFKAVMDCIGMTPYEAMLKVLNSERYSAVRIGMP